MTSAFASAHDRFRLPQLDLLRRVIVLGCPLALIFAGRALPF
ncbi:MAG: hypothetical protein ABJA20_11170 [Novosphingobium sp.]